MKVAEFFAGMGLMRAGLERCGIETVFANDVDKTKAKLYRENWGADELRQADIRELAGRDVPRVDVATASFPCVDLSLAGNRAGLDGPRSGVVFEFMRILGELPDPPPIVIIENVLGFLTADGGRAYQAVVSRLRGLGYKANHICIDAAAFVPQSRQRVFLLGFLDVDPVLLPDPPPRQPGLRLNDIAVADGEWWGAKRLGKFLGSLSDIQAARVDAYQTRPRVAHHGAYRRTRRGRAVWEVRADEIAGTLRTTGGGSGRQAVLRAGNGDLAARWMDVREYAALQGAGGMKYESVSPRQAMYALGDAVCVPVVEWLVRNCVLPLVRGG